MWGTLGVEFTVRNTKPNHLLHARFSPDEGVAGAGRVPPLPGPTGSYSTHHHDKQHSAFIPAAQLAYLPAIQIVAQLDGPEQP